jgi:phenylacetate-CoA ligase
MDHFPAIEKESLVTRQGFQFEKLKTLLAYLQFNSPFYQRRFKEKQVDLSGIRSLQDIIKLPLTDKEDLQQFNSDFLCVPLSEIREYTCTSGTLGNPVTIALSEKDLQRLAYNERLSFQGIGLGKNDTVQLMLTMDRQFMAGMAYYSGIRETGAVAVRSGPGLPAMQWDSIQRYGTTTLVTVPSFLLRLIAEKPEGYSLKDSSVQKVLAIGESLKNEQLEDNALAKAILNKWEIQLFNTYASTEMQTAFTECSERKGGHHHPELLIVELLDDDGVPVKEDEAGEVTVTTLGVEAMPLLRYRTGDMCRAYYEPCACGRNTMRLGPVLARKKQMIKYKGTTLFPSTAIEIIMQTEAIEDYVLQISKDPQEQDCLTFYLQTKSQPEYILALLRPLFQHKLRVVPEIRFLDAAGMKALQYPNQSRKPVKILDLRFEI